MDNETNRYQPVDNDPIRWQRMDNETNRYQPVDNDPIRWQPDEDN